MPDNSSPSFTSRSGGVRHPPEADIESIRDLLRGYGSIGGILKELFSLYFLSNKPFSQVRGLGTVRFTGQSP